MPENLVWFFRSLGLLLVWLVVFLLAGKSRRERLQASLLTMPFGLTEPLLVPAYGDPPFLFEPARRTGFDIESLVFPFAIGGLGVVLFDLVLHEERHEMAWTKRHKRRHRFHLYSPAAPLVVILPAIFLTRLFIFLGHLPNEWVKRGDLPESSV